MLRPYEFTDEHDYVALMHDEQVSQWVDSPPGDLGAMFRRMVELRKASLTRWAVIEDGQLVGHAEISPSSDDRVPGHEVEYALRPDVWGRGLGKEVVRAGDRVCLAPGFRRALRSRRSSAGP